MVVAEGAKSKGGDVVIKKIVKKSADPVWLGGIGFVLQDALERMTSIESWTVVQDYLQGGASTTAADRILATQLGAKAVDLIIRGDFGKMVSVQEGKITSASLQMASGGPRMVPLDRHELRD